MWLWNVLSVLILWFGYGRSNLIPGKSVLPTELGYHVSGIIQDSVILLSGKSQSLEFNLGQFWLNISTVNESTSVDEIAQLQWQRRNSDGLYRQYVGQMSVTVDNIMYVYDQGEAALYKYNGQTAIKTATTPSLIAACVMYNALNSTIQVFGRSSSGSGVIREYNPATNSWRLVTTQMPEPKLFSQCVNYKGNVYIFGGRDLFQTTLVFDTVYKYNRAQDKWTKMSIKMGLPRYEGQAILIDDYVLLMGGSMTGSSTNTLYHSMSTVEVFNLNTETRVGYATSLFRARYGCGIAYDSSKKLLFVSGGVSQNFIMNDWEFWDMRTLNIQDYLISDPNIVYVYDPIYSSQLSTFNLTNVLTTTDMEEAYSLSSGYSEFSVRVLTDMIPLYRHQLNIRSTLESFSIECYSVTGNCTVWITEPINDYNQFLLVNPPTTGSVITEITITNISFDVSSTSSFGGIYYLSTQGSHQIYTTFKWSTINLTDVDSKPSIFHYANFGRLTIDTVSIIGHGPADTAIFVGGNAKISNVRAIGLGSGDIIFGPIYLQQGTVEIDNLYIEGTYIYYSAVVIYAPVYVLISDLVCLRSNDFYNEGRSACVFVYGEYFPGLIDISNVQIKDTQASCGGLRFQNSPSIITLSNIHITDVVGDIGAISCLGCDSNLTIYNSTFTRCRLRSSSFGGGITYESQNNASVFTCDGSTFVNCSARAGGAIALEGGNTKIINSKFLGNLAFKDGAGVYLNTQGTLDVKNCLFERNKADQGAGITFIKIKEDLLSITNSTFRENLVSSYGGGVSMPYAGRYIVKDCLFEGNVAKQDGGGFYDGNGYAKCKAQTSYIYTSMFRNNTAQQGGGLLIRGCNVQVFNTTFEHNYASGIGGALMLDSASGENKLKSLTIQNNIAGRNGGGIVVTGGSPMIIENLIQNNQAHQNGGGVYIRASEGWVLKSQIISSTIIHNKAVAGAGINVEADKDFYDWNESPELLMTQVTVEENHASGNGGGIRINSGSVKTIDCTIVNNTAVNGGGLNYESGWYQDFKSTYTNNIVEKVGGGIHTLEKKIQLNQTHCDHNKADFGAGLYMEQCPIYTSSSITFKENEAIYSGGGVQAPDNCISWCSSCLYQNNEAASGADQSSKPVEMKCEWKIPKTINRATKLAPVCRLYDAFGTVLTLFSDPAVAYVNFDSEIKNSVVISGATNPSFTGGSAQFGFYLSPPSDRDYSEYSTKVTITLTTNVNVNFVATYEITFDNEVWKVSSGILSLAILLGVIIIFTTFFFSMLTWYYSAQPIIRGATLPFLWMILGGCFVMSFFVTIAPLAPQLTDCTSQLWLVHIAFILIVFPIAGKTWRIYNIFFTARKRLKKSNWNTSRLFIIFLVIPLIGALVYLIIWTVLKFPDETYDVDSNGVIYSKCTYNSTFSIVSLVTAVAFLLWIVQLAVSVRNVPKNFNESRWLGASVYTISIVFLFIIPLSVLRDVHFVAQRIFVTVGCFVVTEAVLLFLFGVKFVKIWNGSAQKPNKPKSDHREASSVVSSTGKDSTMESSSPRATQTGNGTEMARMKSLSAGSEEDIQHRPTTTGGFEDEGPRQTINHTVTDM